MYLYIIFSSLFNSILIGLFGKFLGRQAVIFISLLTLISGFICSLIILYEILLNNNILIINLYNLLVIYDIKIDIGFLFDSLTSVMLFVVLSISTLVHIFTAGYMSHDPFIVRFYTFLGFFTFFMILLVTADNFLQLFVGWEGVGVCPYLLINFWYNRIAANKAAIKAMLMNRIADVFFIFAIVLILYYFKTLNYLLVFSLIDYIQEFYVFILFWNVKVVDLIVFFLFLGAIGKSAQIGLHTWLPDAMEGPTPVSSLLHAATTVTAGVFLLIRCSFLFEKSNLVLFLIILFGSVTALFFAIVATYQYDIKKIIAYSTCSQLGYMFFSSGLSNYNITLFHLFNHAFFKALLFLGAGSIISSLLDEQDMRRMGSLIYKMPFTYISIVIGSLAILGFPFLTGFYSKDILLEATIVSYSLDSIYVYIIGVLTAFFTAMYSFKLLFFIFIIKTNIYKKNIIIQELNFYILLPLFILSVLSIFIGFFFFEIFVGIGSDFLINSIYINYSHYNNIEVEFLSPLIKNIPLILSFFGFFLGYYFFYFLKFKNIKLNFLSFKIKKILYEFFFNAGFFNFFYNRLYILMFKFFYKVNVKYIEKGFFEIFGPVGFYLFFRDLSYKARFLSPYFLNASLFLIFFYLVFVLYIIIINNIIIIKNVYFLLLLYYLLFYK
jgi:NADH-quinone oxidoreductase subunit L